MTPKFHQSQTARTATGEVTSSANSHKRVAKMPVLAILPCREETSRKLGVSKTSQRKSSKGKRKQGVAEQKVFILEAVYNLLKM